MNFILFESSSGFALLDVVQHEEIGNLTDEVQQQFQDVSKFCKMVKLKAFQPFTSAENALENINHISEHVLSDDLRTFLEYFLECFRAHVIVVGLCEALRSISGASRF